MSTTTIKSISAPRPLKAGSTWANQKITFVTNLFGKEYYWMQDTDKTTYLARVGLDGTPEII